MWHSLKKEEVFDRLKTSEHGLKEWQVKEREKKFGPNEIRKIKKKSKFLLFLEQFNSLLIYVLVGAVVVSALIGHFIDAVIIFIIILINGSIGFIQEYKAEEIIEKLKKSLVYRVSVFRGGKLKEVNSKEIVVGDVLKLQEGDKIPADCFLIHSENLQVNEAILTGESFPVEKSFLQKGLKKNTILAERKNLLYAGTNIVRGNCLAVVVSTGRKTEFGKLAELVQTTKDDKMPLQKKMDSFSKKISIAILGFVFIVFLVGISSGEGFVEMLLTSISLAVGAIPEGLPAVIAIILAVAIKKMYKANTLVRKLPAAETLGRATVICTDKTGTLTEEELSVDEIFVSGKKYSFKSSLDKNLKKVLEIGVLCNNARDEYDKFLGDPTEIALIKSAKKFDLDKKKLTEENSRVKEFPFSSERKMMSIVRENKNKKISYVKGAPSVVLPKCEFEFVDGELKKLSKKKIAELEKVYEKMAESGLRVLAFGFKEVSKSVTRENAEEGLVFVGFQGMIDPPREEVKGAIHEAVNAGIEIKVITGDAALTTKSIANKIGLNVTSEKIIEGAELEKLSEKDWFKVVKEKTIFARTTPQQKLKIVETLKEQKETIAVTGDGVNDILALKKADIGVAMGLRGADVTRDASDMVLLDDNFASIVKAVKEGRTVFDNLKKSIKFLLAANIGEVFAVIGGLLLGFPLVFLPLAILWMNLVTDSLPALALAVEPSESNVMSKPKKGGLLQGIWGWFLVAGLLNFLSAIFTFWYGFDFSLDVARTMATTTAIFFELSFVFACKSHDSLFKTGIFNNKYLIYAVLLSTGLHLVAVYTLLGSVFDFVPLTFKQLGISVLASLSGLVVFEVWKLFKKFKKTN